MQMNELEQAITRATNWGIEVRGKGHRRSDGVRVWTTTSREDVNRWHTVALVRGSRQKYRLVCDCQARKACCHIGAVYMRLVVQADRYQRLAESIEAAYKATLATGTPGTSEEARAVPSLPSLPSSRPNSSGSGHDGTAPAMTAVTARKAVDAVAGVHPVGWDAPLLPSRGNAAFSIFK